MQRHLHRTLLFCATLIALTALYGCKSAPENTADAAAETDVIQDSSATLDRVEVSGTRIRREDAQRGTPHRPAARRGEFVVDLGAMRDGDDHPAVGVARDRHPLPLQRRLPLESPRERQIDAARMLE